MFMGLFPLYNFEMIQKGRESWDSISWPIRVSDRKLKSWLGFERPQEGKKKKKACVVIAQERGCRTVLHSALSHRMHPRCV